MEDRNKSVLLYSGGMDSWLINELIKPDIALFINIGTPNNNLEYENLLRLKAKGEVRSNIKVIKYDLSEFERPEQNYYLPLRNLHFVTLGAHYGNII